MAEKLHDPWFRAKVQEALNDPHPAIPHDQAEAHFAKRRAAAFEARYVAWDQRRTKPEPNQ